LAAVNAYGEPRLNKLEGAMRGEKELGLSGVGPRVSLALAAVALAAFSLAAGPPAAMAQAPLTGVLGPPVRCAPQAACYVQNLPDVDPGPAHRDTACGLRSYDGHDGVDVRVRTAAMRAGVPVLAPVAGVVKGVRAGEPDGLMRTAGPDAVKDKECGNGVLIDAGGGLEVQLCHLRQGSVSVRVGQQVAAGEAVGLVGQSGQAAFPHVHVSVRRNGAKLDPQSGAPLAQAQCRADASDPGPQSLWSAAARAELPFNTRTVIADWGFIETPPTEASPADLAPPASGARTAPALVFYAAFAGPAQGDVLELKVTGPDGATVAEQRFVQPRDQAQRLQFAGRRQPTGGWPPGAYRAEATLSRAGQTLDRRVETLNVR
jgi:murein DD-endopeptidase MepM/ murein hydrolase activator NlpD